MADLPEKREIKRAAALKYDPDSDVAPVLAAFGEGHVADKIVEVAREAGLPVVPDESLASMLGKLSVGDEIPAELYEVVARIMLFVSETDSDYKKRLEEKIRAGDEHEY